MRFVKTSSPTLSPAYWDRAIAPQPRLWREHADSLNRAWLSRLLAATEGLVLKTDAFDEAVGAGLGRYLLDRFEHVVLMDLGGGVIRKAGAELPVLATQADARALPFPPESFDTVVSISSFDHFRESSDLAAALAETARVLKQGGSLLITMDNLANPVVWLRNEVATSLLMRLHIVPYFVGRTFTPAGLVRALEEGGLQISDVGTLMHCPRVLSVLTCKLAGRIPSKVVQKGLLRLLSWFEWLRRGPAPNLTGYYVAVRATKRS